MKKFPPVPKRNSYSPALLKLRRGEQVFLKDASPASVKVIASRLGFRLGRTFMTEKAKKPPQGVHVWRKS